MDNYDLTLQRKISFSFVNETYQYFHKQTSVRYSVDESFVVFVVVLLF